MCQLLSSLRLCCNVIGICSSRNRPQAGGGECFCAPMARTANPPYEAPDQNWRVTRPSRKSTNPLANSRGPESRRSCPRNWASVTAGLALIREAGNRLSTMEPEIALLPGRTGRADGPNEMSVMAPPQGFNRTSIPYAAFYFSCVRRTLAPWCSLNPSSETKVKVSPFSLLIWKCTNFKKSCDFSAPLPRQGPPGRCVHCTI